MEQNSPAVGAPVEPTVRPCAWADDKVMAGHVGNCASDAAKTYWQRSNQFDRMMAERLTHPLYTQAQLDAAVAAERERAARVCDDEARIRKEAGKAHPLYSDSRDRCNAAARAARNCALGVRGGEVV